MEGRAVFYIRSLRELILDGTGSPSFSGHLSGSLQNWFPWCPCFSLNLLYTVLIRCYLIAYRVPKLNSALANNAPCLVGGEEESLRACQVIQTTPYHGIYCPAPGTQFADTRGSVCRIFVSVTFRCWRRRFSRSFMLAVTKPKKRTKKKKALSAKEKSANSRFFLPPTMEAWLQSPKPLDRGKSKGLE